MLQSIKRIDIAKLAFNSIKCSQNEGGQRFVSRYVVKSQPVISSTLIYHASASNTFKFPGGTFAELYNFMDKKFRNQKDEANKKDDGHEDDDHNILDLYVVSTEITYNDIGGEQIEVSWKGGKLSQLRNYLKELPDVTEDSGNIYDDEESYSGSDDENNDKKDEDDMDGKKYYFDETECETEQAFAKYYAVQKARLQK